MKNKFTLLVVLALFFAGSLKAQNTDERYDRKEMRKDRISVYRDRDDMIRDRMEMGRDARMGYLGDFRKDRREWLHDRRDFFRDRRDLRYDRRDFYRDRRRDCDEHRF